MSLFIGVLISLCFLQVAVALPHANLPYQNVEVRAGSKLVIPCDLTTDGVTGNEKIDFEWGFTPDGSDRYRTIMRRSDVKLHPEVPPELRVHLYPTHPIQGDCSLVINPILMEDSGTYEIKVTVNGAQSGPIRRIIVHMEDSPLMTAGRKFSARRKAMVQLQEPMAFAEEEQMAAVEEGQATGKKYNARSIAMVHSPVNKLNAGHMPMVPRQEQTPTVEEQQTVAVKEGQERPVDKKQTTGRKLSERRKAMVQLLEPMAFAEEEQMAAVEEGQTTGKKDNARRIAMIHSPVNTFHSGNMPTVVRPEQKLTVEEKQAPAVEEGQARPVDNWKTTGKKYITKLLGKFHRPEKTTMDKQTPTAEEKQAPAVEKGQARPVDNWKTTGKKFIAIAKLLGKLHSPEKTTTDKQTPTAEEKQAPAVEKEQTRPVDKEKTTGKEYNAKHLAMVHSPGQTTTADKQTPTAEENKTLAVEEGQARPVDKEQTEIVDEGLTTGKTGNARHKATVHHPVDTYEALGREIIRFIKKARTIMEEETNSKQYNNTRRKAWPKPTVHSQVTTTIHIPVNTTIQTTTVDKTPMGLVKSIVKKLKKYAILLGIGLLSGIPLFLAWIILSIYMRRRRDRQAESTMEEGRHVTWHDEFEQEEGDPQPCVCRYSPCFRILCCFSLCCSDLCCCSPCCGNMLDSESEESE